MLSTIGVYTLMYIGKFLIWLSLLYSPNHQIKYLNKVSHCVVSSFTSEDNSTTALPSLKYCRLGLLRTYSVHVFGVYKPLVSRIRKYALIENCPHKRAVYKLSITTTHFSKLISTQSPAHHGYHLRTDSLVWPAQWACAATAVLPY